LIYKEQSLSAEADVEQIQMNLLAEKVAHGTKDGDQLHWWIFRPFSVADCPAQFRNPDLKTTSGIVWRLEKQAKDCLTSSLCKTYLLTGQKHFFPPWKSGYFFEHDKFQRLFYDWNMNIAYWKGSFLRYL
jgi:hypothetical protein